VQSSLVQADLMVLSMRNESGPKTAANLNAVAQCYNARGGSLLGQILDLLAQNSLESDALSQLNQNRDG
jgi:hypothetical protein